MEVLKPAERASVFVRHSIYDFDVTFLILIETMHLEDSGVVRYGAVELGGFFLKFRLRVVPPSSRAKQFKKNSHKTCYGVYPSSYSNGVDDSCFKGKASGA